MEIKKLSLEKASGILKAIAHPVRISIIGCLEHSKSRSVTEIHKLIVVR